MNQQQIAAVRAFNRMFTRQIGALDESFLGRGRPLAQARLIYEIGGSGADVRSLRMRLGHDSGYLSRLLRSLEEQGLLSTSRHDRDGRCRIVRLSNKGLRELAQYDRRSDEFARSVLEGLDRAERIRLLEALADALRLLRLSTLAVDVEDPAAPDATWCLEQYFRELATRFDAGFDPSRSISASSTELTAPRGIFLVARSLGQPVGCGALKIKEDGIGEIKRMWVDGAARGIGVGRRILAALERHASTRGIRTLRLETNRALKEAQRLYRSSGFREVPAFNDEPYAHHWFEKALPKAERPGTR